MATKLPGEGEAPGAVACFMINCAHPSHFADALETGAPWLLRVRGIRANASDKSHAQLDAATELDRGDPDDLALRYAALLGQVPEMSVLGGCCGTDHHHIAAIAGAVDGHGSLLRRPRPGGGLRAAVSLGSRSACGVCPRARSGQGDTTWRRENDRGTAHTRSARRATRPHHVRLAAR